MNERVMQFRIGMFVIVAGLVLIMMIIWFGESPTILRDQVFVKVHYTDAPGVSDGIPVRRSGIKIGEVSHVAFDEREGQPDGVIVTLAFKKEAKLKIGTIPRISRALIGDVSIEMTPGTGIELLPVGTTAAKAPLIEGEVSPDPAKALSAATTAFERVGGTLSAIEDAAKGVANVTKRAEKIDEFIATWTAMGSRVDGVIRANEGELGPTIANLRAASARFNTAFDEKTAAELKSAITRINAAAARLDAGLADMKPLFTDLGAAVDVVPVTNFGQTIWRANRITSDIGLLTRSLSDGQGRLNPNGSIQRLFTSPALHDNLNKMAAGANDVIASLRPVVASLREFADHVKRDPAAITRGALQR